MLQYKFQWCNFFTSLLNTENAVQNSPKGTGYLDNDQPCIQAISQHPINLLDLYIKNKGTI